MRNCKIDALVAEHYRSNEYPAAYAQAVAWETEKPLAGLTVIDATPIFCNTLTKYQALLAAGAQLKVGLSNVMPADPDIVHFLKNEANIEVIEEKDGPFTADLILDCAASFITSTARIGCVELTRSGVSHYNHYTKPVFVADAGRIKRIETCLGTGESFYRAMDQLGYSQWEGKRLVIFGSGKVGTGLIRFAHKKGAKISVVTDPKTISPQLKALTDVDFIRFNDSSRIQEAVTKAYAVVTATGIAGAATAFCPAEVFTNSQALLANMGVEDEYGAAVSSHRVLEEKRPLNFILKEPTLIAYIDATLALHNAGAVYLAQHPHAQGLIDPPAQLEEELLQISRTQGILGDQLDDI